MVEKWTKGPWQDVNRDSNGDMLIVRPGSSDHHWQCIAHGVRPDNASLIKAAPDLYAALDAMIKSQWLSIDFAHNRTPEAVDLRRQACDALNKARGEG